MATTCAVVFVTAVYDLGRGDYETTLWSALSLLVEALPRSGARLHVWCAPSAAVPACVASHAAVVICHAELHEFACYRTGMTAGIRLPATANTAKDTQAYLALMNTKMEMVSRAAFQAQEVAAARCHPAVPLPTYAWIDAGAAKMWNSNVADIARALEGVVHACIPSLTFVAPGCTELPAVAPSLAAVMHLVWWRYCGTFFAVAGDSACRVCDWLSAQYINTVTTTGHITWEVNLWALADMGSARPPFRFAWYAANHDHTLLNIPRRVAHSTQVVISKTSSDGLGNVLKGYLSLRRIHDNVAVQCCPGYMYGMYDTVLTSTVPPDLDPAALAPGADDVQFAYTCRLLVLKDEEKDQQHIANEFPHTNGCGNVLLNQHFSSTTLIDWNYDVRRLCPRLLADVVRTVRLVPWHPAVREAVAALMPVVFGADACTEHGARGTLGISVRTWRAAHEHDIARPYAFDTYAAAIRAAIQATACVEPVERVLLSIDVGTPQVWQQYIDLLQGELGLHTLLLDGPTQLHTAHDGCCPVPLSDALNPLQVSAVKMLLLSKAATFVCNRISTFSELVFWFGECRARIVTVY